MDGNIYLFSNYRGIIVLVCSITVTILILIYYETHISQLENAQIIGRQASPNASSFQTFHISNLIVNSSQRTIYSRIRNITFPANASSPWPMYRLGDMFKNSKQRKRRDGWRLHRRRFNSSIAVEYMRRIVNPLNGTEGNSNFSMMIQIVNERIERNKTLQSMLPDNKTLVVHLRTGDVIDIAGSPLEPLPNHIPVETYLNLNVAKPNGIAYTRGLPFYSKIWDEIQSKGIQIDRILVITGWHFEIAHYRSIAYINEVIKYLEQMVDRVDIRVNENPDEDFIIMSRSKYFVQSGGGFSRILGKMIHLSGGTVFGNRGVVRSKIYQNMSRLSA